MQQLCDILSKKRDTWHMILGDNPAGHSFVSRDLVLTELLEHAIPLRLGEGGLKISETFLLGGRSKMLILVGVILFGGHVILKCKLKLHNTSIKSILE